MAPVGRRVRGPRLTWNIPLNVNASRCRSRGRGSLLLWPVDQLRCCGTCRWVSAGTRPARGRTANASRLPRLQGYGSLTGSGNLPLLAQGHAVLNSIPITSAKRKPISTPTRFQFQAYSRKPPAETPLLAAPNCRAPRWSPRPSVSLARPPIRALRLQRPAVSQPRESAVNPGPSECRGSVPQAREQGKDRE